MNNILVLYKSKYGSTKKYADMMKEELLCDIFDIDNYNLGNLSKYNLIVIAGGIYAGGISGVKFLKKNFKKFEGKKIVIFAVGASPFDEKALEQIKQHSLKDLPVGIPFFYGRGAYDESSMDFKDRTLCRMLKKALSKKAPSTLDLWAAEFLAAEGKICDWIDKAYLIPFFQYIREQTKTLS
ncbi:MAG: flavodoxin [Ruminococcus sp.]|nr:flavodoxin [Ruminococcus sp.]